MPDDQIPDFIRKLRENSKNALPPSEEEKRIGFPEEDIPETPDARLTQEQIELQTFLDGIDILQAYRQWCGKTKDIKIGSKREGIMVSCPHHHPDNDPSAAVNLDKQLYCCYKCMKDGSGDIYTIAAEHFGYPIPGYQDADKFPKLKRQMAESMGYVIQRTLGGTELAVKPVPETSSEPDDDHSNVIEFPVPESNDLDENELEQPLSELYVDWESIVPQETFLRTWMEETTIDDLPHEYYFWLGLQAIGFAAGADQLLADFALIKPNLYLCLYGRTGTGKSRALYPYQRLLNEALPYKYDQYAASRGVDLLPPPASSEALIKMFNYELLDPSTNQVIDLAPKRGLIRVEEFAGFIAKSVRMGNPMKETLIEMHDVLDGEIATRSISGGLTKAYAPFAQMVTTTQPKAIHAFLERTDAHSGFLNRFVFAYGRRRTSRIAWGGVQQDITSPILFLKNLHLWCSTPNLMQMTPQSLQVWSKFFHKEIVPLQEEQDESMMSRIDLVLKKIILLFTINEMKSQPTPDIVERAISLFDYLRTTYSSFTNDLAHSVRNEVRLRIREICKKFQSDKKQGATLREIRQRIGQKYDAGLIVKVLKTMIELGELEEVITQGKRGPTTSRYVCAY